MVTFVASTPQLYEESHFNPFARSAAGALGVAQFMPATAARYGLADPFDADYAIDAQAHLMRDLLRTFAAVPLALAAYNAGRARPRLRLRPADAGDQSYVADLLGLLHGAGDASGDGAGALEVRLVRRATAAAYGRPLAGVPSRIREAVRCVSTCCHEPHSPTHRDATTPTAGSRWLCQPRQAGAPGAAPAAIAAL